MGISGSSKRICGLLGGAVLALLSAAAIGDSTVVAGSKAAGLDACVEPTPDIIRNHMEYLKHERDETVIEGIRGRKHSLSGCIDCHVSFDQQQPVPVTAPGQFCESCHRKAAVSFDCFQCHATVPRSRPNLSLDMSPAPPLRNEPSVAQIQPTASRPAATALPGEGK